MGRRGAAYVLALDEDGMVASARSGRSAVLGAQLASQPISAPPRRETREKGSGRSLRCSAATNVSEGYTCGPLCPIFKLRRERKPAFERVTDLSIFFPSFLLGGKYIL